MTFRCEYCERTFKRESSIAKHMCEKKRRWLNRDQKPVKLGLEFYNAWYRLAMGATGQKDYKEFMSSRYYNAFIRFGHYVYDTRVISPDEYLKWLIKSKIPVDDWCKDSVYNQFLSNQTKRETVERALERFVLHAEKWANKTGHDWFEYWDKVKPFALVNDIKMGKISPWIFLGYKKAKDVLNELPDELLDEIADTVDLNHWQEQIDNNRQSVDWINDILSNHSDRRLI